MNKAYINITNKCNEQCPFCCMYSSPEKNRFMDIRKFIEILDNESKNGKFIVQLEGGEPLMHKDFSLFLGIAASMENVNEIIIDTNSILLFDYIDVIVRIAEYYKKRVTIKPSVNWYLCEKNKNLITNLKNLISSIEFLTYVDYEINVRGKNDDELQYYKSILEGLKANYHLFNAYGRLKNSKNAPQLIVNNVYDNWNLYASDGKCFNQNLIDRSEYEK